MQSCGMPMESSEVIRLGHGSGGKLTERLIEKVFIPRIGNPILNALDDAALNREFQTGIFNGLIRSKALSGGNIGSLAVHGTVNDLAMRMARPLYLSAAFIIEEGFQIACLEKIVDSFSIAAKEANVQIVAADTKVVNRGAGDGVYINTTGIGIIDTLSCPSVINAKPDDIVILSGDIGRHGIAVLCAREGLDLETELLSDAASLHNIVSSLSHFEQSIHCMRDLTRGGLSSALNEIAQASGVGIEIDDSLIAIHPSVKGACELLGLDPLYVACEGRFACVVEPRIAEQVIEALKKNELGQNAAIVGTVNATHPGRVVTKTSIGGRRIVDKLSGDQLPRIC